MKLSKKDRWYLIKAELIDRGLLPRDMFISRVEVRAFLRGEARP